MATKQGIDLSYVQTNVDYKKLKAAGIDFAIIRAGYGRDLSQKDTMFEKHYKGCKDAGIKVGAYWFSYAVSESDAVTEANTCLNIIKGKTFEYPIYYDVENQSQFARGKSFCDSITKAFLSKLESAGYYVGLYTSRYPAQTYFSQSVLNKYALWLAEYGSKLNYSGTYGMWQNSSTYRVNGINGDVDHDYCYVDYPTIIKNGGYNGYKKPTPAKTKKTLDTKGYKKGCQPTTGVYAVKKLITLAYKKQIITQSVNNDKIFGNGTEKAVNQLLKKWGYKENGIAGDNFVEKLEKILE